MRILFVGMCAHYTVGLNYQDNQFCKYFVERGDEVVYISDPNEYIDGKLVYVGEKNEKISKNFTLNRKGYLFKQLSLICSKLKLFKSIYSIIDDFKPDIIYCHGPQYISVLDVVRYKKKNPKVLVYADTHTGYHNVNTENWYFLLLYKVYYKSLYKTLEPYLKKYFYVGDSEKDFSLNIYNSDINKMEFLPLSGEEISNSLYIKYRNEIRNKLKLSENDILILHSGKLDKYKRTEWIIDAINSINDKRIKLVIAGLILEDNLDLNKKINQSNNVLYIGWIDGKNLRKYLCASDLYCQPGSPSVTLQTAICCKTPIICFKHKLYNYLFDYKSIMWIKNMEGIVDILHVLLDNKNDLINLKKQAEKNSYRLDTKFLLENALEI